VTQYVHETCPTGFAIVECAGGNLVIDDAGNLVEVPAGTGYLKRITHGDPEFDAMNEKMNEHMRRSFL